LSGTPASPRRIVDPLPGQEQLAIDSRPALGAGVAQEDPDLAVLDLAGGARVLAGDARRLSVLLEESSLVGHEDALRMAQLGQDIRPQVVADGVGVPGVAVQDALNPPRVRIACLLRELPAVLAFHVGDQSAQVVGGMPRCGPAETRPKPFGNLLDGLGTLLRNRDFACLGRFYAHRRSSHARGLHQTGRKGTVKLVRLTKPA
jgi:hypothetical protein